MTPDDAPRNAGHEYRERLPEAARGRTVLAWLAHAYRHSDEAAWRERLARGEVTLDGAVATGEEVLRPGRVLAWRRPPWEEGEVPLAYGLLHEDDALIAVNKPSGLPTMHGGGFLARTLLALVRARFPEAVPMHRLGRATSGLVLFARTPDAASALSRAWRERAVEKRYRALASGAVPWEERSIEAPIGPVPHPRLGTVHAATPDGKPARSVARVLERRADGTLCEVDIETGRPHQIRVHLAWAGHPLAGDPLYAPGGLPREDDPGLPGDGGYLLHAERLVVTHPSTGARLELHAPPPDALRTAAERAEGRAGA